MCATYSFIQNTLVRIARHQKQNISDKTYKKDDFKIYVSSALHDDEWDDFLIRTEKGHYVQSSLWGQIKIKRGLEVLRIMVYKNDQIKGGAQILMRKVKVIGYIGYLTRGPVFESEDSKLISFFFHNLIIILKNYRLRFLAVQLGHANEDIENELKENGIESNSLSNAPFATTIIDLKMDEDIILSNMRKKTRKNIRVGLKSNINVRQGDFSDLDIFYSLYRSGSKRNNFRPFNKAHLINMWRTLDSRKWIRLFIAESQGEPVSAFLVVSFRDTIYTILSGWSGKYSELRPNYALEWNTILWAKWNGYQYYDFEGIDSDCAIKVKKGEKVPNSIKKSATLYKIGFGGQIHIFPRNYIYIYNSTLRYIYKILYKNKLTKSILNRIANIF
jgi:lipid II:glycine glycyltransferase (peptidoglycan interpeptide bridge formation enzyme)